MQINLEIEFKDFIVHCTMYCTSFELEKKRLKWLKMHFGDMQKTHEK